MKNRIALVTGSAHGSRALDRRARRRTVAATKLPDKATDAQVLAWVQGNKNPIIVGGWLFMLGCIVFILFAGAAAEPARGGRGRRRTRRDDRVRAAPSRWPSSACGTQTDIVAGDQRDRRLAGGRGRVPPPRRPLLHRRRAVAHRRSSAAVAVLASAHGGAAALVGRPRRDRRGRALIGPIGWAALIFGLPGLAARHAVARRARRAQDARRRPVDRVAARESGARRRRAATARRRRRAGSAGPAAARATTRSRWRPPSSSGRRARRGRRAARRASPPIRVPRRAARPAARPPSRRRAPPHRPRA